MAEKGWCCYGHSQAMVGIRSEIQPTSKYITARAAQEDYSPMPLLAAATIQYSAFFAPVPNLPINVLVQDTIRTASTDTPF